MLQLVAGALVATVAPCPDWFPGVKGARRFLEVQRMQEELLRAHMHNVEMTLNPLFVYTPNEITRVDLQ